MKIRTAIIGSGNIGTDLCERLIMDRDFQVSAFIGRRTDSSGLQRLTGKVPTLSEGSTSLKECLEDLDCIFDATSANDHKELWTNLLANSGKLVIDLTPSQIGIPIVPVLVGKIESMNLKDISTLNLSMVTCGGQSSAPVVYAIARHCSNVLEVEVSSSIASLSAGPATRRNLDQYIKSTEELSTLLTGCQNAKAILVLNPADPPILMRTTVHVRAESFNIGDVIQEVNYFVKEVQKYVPGYEVAVAPHAIEPTVVSATVKVKGAGHFLPEYSGNLDIINAAAVESARRYFYELE